MITELPYDIWRHIFSFLHPKTIQQLRFVNTLFYNALLDDYHRITQIGYPYRGINYPPLRDLGNARRARVLLIRRGPIYSPKDESLARRGSYWKSIKAKFSQIRRHLVRHNSETIFDKLLDAVPGLTSLTTLDVYLSCNLDHHSFYWAKLAVIKAGWPIFAANLTTLSLDVPLEEIHLILLPHIMLLRLENFFISLHVFHPTSEPNGLIRNTVLPFLINHGSTLRSLKLEALDAVDMSSILTGLQRMPCLNKLNILQPFESMSFVGHHQFLEAHQSQLEHLTFNFRPKSDFLDITDEFFSQDFCRVLLPELQSLSFRFLSPPVSCDVAAISYFQRNILTVKSLRVYAVIFSYDQVASILAGPKPGKCLTALEMLDIPIWCFSPALLGLLAEKTPRLRSLKLNVSIIGPDEQAEPFGRNKVPEFCEVLQSSCYPEWGLYELNIGYLHDSERLLPSLRNQCKVALFRALPKLKVFCGLGPLAR